MNLLHLGFDFLTLENPMATSCFLDRLSLEGFNLFVLISLLIDLPTAKLQDVLNLAVLCLDVDVCLAILNEMF